MDSSTDEIEYLSEKKSQYKQDDTTSDSDTNDQSKSDHEQGDEDQPSGAECLARCKQFAELTGTDTALAMFYLQDTNWNLERGLNSFYEATNKSNKKIVACFDVEKLDEDERFENNYLKSFLKILYFRFKFFIKTKCKQTQSKYLRRKFSK